MDYNPPNPRSKLRGIASPRVTDYRRLIEETLRSDVQVTGARVVPTVHSVSFNGSAKKLQSCSVLYTDLVEFSRLVEVLRPVSAGKVVQAFHKIAARAISSSGGAIRSFDGDRIMGVFQKQPCTFNSVRCALTIQWVVREILAPVVHTKYKAVLSSGLRVRCVSGVDSGSLVSMKVGKVEERDLVWIGTPANFAAKLSAHRQPNISTLVSVAACKDLFEFPYHPRHVDAVAYITKLPWTSLMVDFAGREVEVAVTDSTLQP